MGSSLNGLYTYVESYSAIGIVQSVQGRYTLPSEYLQRLRERVSVQVTELLEIRGTAVLRLAAVSVPRHNSRERLPERATTGRTTKRAHGRTSRSSRGLAATPALTGTGWLQLGARIPQTRRGNWVNLEIIPVKTT